ncbi:hypothetical protein O6H91_03G090400 [Diphasiastrum complanatum]|uniref:Uncharacterized protein n=1 Tax=Diphasiastrum complanatum TaxID=34168 RepID=A0ACC2E8Y6_DIPCM|nr:hypothetical protein O6H91_03G090400 [Diphasiastrum complanatum]
MYPFGMEKTIQIPISICDPADVHIVYRPLNKHHLHQLMITFAKKPCSIDMIVDLVPYDVKTRIMLCKDEIKEEMLSSYRYYIISRQHSIMAARKLLEVPHCPSLFLIILGHRTSRILCAQDAIRLLNF